MCKQTNLKLKKNEVRTEDLLKPNALLPGQNPSLPKKLRLMGGGLIIYIKQI